MVDAAVRAHGRIDVLFNNAGVGTMVVGGTVETIDLEHWDLAQDVNVRAMYLTSRAALPHLRAAGGGAIINTASVSAFVGRAERPTHAYAASKGAVLSLTRAMAVSFGRDRIRVNAICPGLIRTRLTRDIVDAAERKAAEHQGIPIGRVGEPEDIARCALFLASDDASFITGRTSSSTAGRWRRAADRSARGGRRSRGQRLLGTRGTRPRDRRRAHRRRQGSLRADHRRPGPRRSVPRRRQARDGAARAAGRA